MAPATTPNAMTCFGPVMKLLTDIGLGFLRPGARGEKSDLFYLLSTYFTAFICVYLRPSAD